jgi:HNH endonuclease
MRRSTRSAQALDLSKRGLHTVEFPQHDSRLVPASERLSAAILERRLRHPGDPVLERHVAAAVAKQTQRGARIAHAGGRHTSARIDAVIALAMAVDRAENQPQARPPDWMAVARPCLGCGRLISSGSRCSVCRLRRPRGRRWQATRQLVFQRHGRACHVCGAPATDIAHITPIATGGTEKLSNLWPACACCNRGWR